MERVKSSNVDAFSFEPNAGKATGTLTVRYRDGAVYAYGNVPPELYNRLRTAESKGRFLAQNVRGKFAYRRVS